MSAEDLIDVLRTPRESLGWQEDAFCREFPGDMFFPDKGGSATEAKRVCAMCPVADPCREYALDNFIRYGVYGGTSGYERRAIWRERGVSLDELEAA